MLMIRSRLDLLLQLTELTVLVVVRANIIRNPLLLMQHPNQKHNHKHKRGRNNLLVLLIITKARVTSVMVLLKAGVVTIPMEEPRQLLNTAAISQLLLYPLQVLVATFL
jgi:hypothetical protein